MAPKYGFQCKQNFPNPQIFEKHEDKCVPVEWKPKIKCPHCPREMIDDTSTAVLESILLNVSKLNVTSVIRR